ncbi:MAG: UDP-galactopyranose mutase [Bdellovibrionaceae bacterium]|nr:UDP-galactopyranose mutase [Pseudobdellovibrionaceae bacterium]
MTKIAIVGAGFSGAVIARELAQNGYDVHIFEGRSHVAGNCHTERDTHTGVMTHVYGPHIFHTSDEEVWNYVRQFGEWMPYNHKVKTTVGKDVFLLPVNLHTINQFYRTNFSPAEAREHIEKKAKEAAIGEPKNFEEQGLKFVGKDLYTAFFAGYTKKQWGCEPKELPSSILKRLPLRFNYNDSYFNDPYQSIPKEGYTSIVEKILDVKNIRVSLNTFFDLKEQKNYAHVFYTGPIDAYFNYQFGRLGYRTLDFEKHSCDGDYQGCPVMNYGDPEVPYTRITEHKHFAPWEEHAKTVYYKEFSRECGEKDIPYYPIRLVQEQKMLNKYVEEANNLSGVTFVGRLGTYRYIDMDKTIREALDVGRGFLKYKKENTAVPVFFQAMS